MAAPSEFIVTAPAPKAGAGRLLGVRVAETFFRRWPVLLLPIVLLTGLGVVKAGGIASQYRSTGTVSVVSATFLSDLTDVRSNTAGFLSPAEQTAQSINEQLSSDTFTRDVAVGAGLTTALDRGQITLDGIRKIVSAGARGDTLLAVVATSDNPELSARLASSLITTYTNFVLTRQTGESDASAAFWQSRVDDYTTQVNAAQAALSAYITEHPEPALGTRPETETLELNRLSATLDQAQTVLDDAQTKLNDSKLATETASADINLRLQVVDQPKVPAAPESVKRDQILAVAVFMFLGGLIALAVWLVLALLDHTVRSVGDLASTGLAVVATIQRVPSMSSRAAFAAPRSGLDRSQIERAPVAGT